MIQTHPLWSESKLPPNTINAINRRSGEDRHNYLSDLLSTYETKISELDAIMRVYAEKYGRGQVRHFRRVIAEIEAIMALELSGATTYLGEDYVDNRRKRTRSRSR